MSLTLNEQRQLDGDGYVVLSDLMGAQMLSELRQRVDQIFADEGDQAGSEFKQEPGCRRLANLADKGEVFQRVIAMPRLLDYLRHVLGPALKLSSLNVRSVNAHWPENQPLHADMGAVADEKGYWVCNTVWMLDDFSRENGAIRAVPGSHRFGRLPQDSLPDPRATHPNEVLVMGRAGDVVVMNAHVWHGGLANRTPRPRLALHAFYCRADKPQQQYQKRLLRPETQARLPADARALLALDDEENDRLSAEGSGRSGFMK